jgi:hypothetical protein
VERTIRGGQVRYEERRQGLSAFAFLGALPWAVVGWAAANPLFWAVGGLFLLGALALQIPVRSIAVDRPAGALRLVARAWGRPTSRETIPLDELRGVRADGAVVRIELPGGRSLEAGRRRGPDDARRFAERLAEDLGCPLKC